MGKQRKNQRRTQVIPWAVVTLSFILAVFLGADGLPVLLRLAPKTATTLVAPVPTVTLDNVYTSADAGYHVAYPATWTATPLQPSIPIFLPQIIGGAQLANDAQHAGVEILPLSTNLDEPTIASYLSFVLPLAQGGDIVSDVQVATTTHQQTLGQTTWTVRQIAELVHQEPTTSYMYHTIHANKAFVIIINAPAMTFATIAASTLTPIISSLVFA